MSAIKEDDILLQAEKISSLITTASRLMADGKTVDLSNLEGKIQSLCENAEAAQLQQAGPVRAALSAIVENLNRLDAEMTSRHTESCAPSLETTIKRAIDAYKIDNEES